MVFHHRGEFGTQRSEIPPVLDIAPQGDRRRCLRRRIVPIGVVNGKGEHRRIVGEGDTGTVAVVQVEIDDQMSLYTQKPIPRSGAA